MSNLFCERKTKWIGLAFWLLFWAVLVGTMLHSCSKPVVSAAKLEMSRRERSGGFGGKSLGRAIRVDEYGRKNERYCL